MLLGYIFSDALELVARRIGLLGNWTAVVVATALAAYVLIKFIQRRRFLRSLRIARITPEEVKRRLDLGDTTLAIIDTRSALDVAAEPHGIPGALWIAAEDIDRRRDELPRGREIVLYCS
jgi:hypothetical protein